MEEKPEEAKPNHSLFPLFPSTAEQTPLTLNNQNAHQWLCNSSFTTDLSVVNDAVSAAQAAYKDDYNDDEKIEDQRLPSPSPSCELLVDESDEERQRKKRDKRKPKRKRSKEGEDKLGVFVSAKSKDYYFDSHGDRDNLVYGRLYRMDVPRYKVYDPQKLSRLQSEGFRRLNKRDSIFDGDYDVNEMDSKVKSAGRYWSAKQAALERHKNFKHVRLIVPKKFAVSDCEDGYIPLVENNGLDDSSVLEESWEDEVLRKTKEFNKLTREHPFDVKGWLDFADFQDVVGRKELKKGVRAQILEKKICILEKAVELNPDNEDLMLSLMKAYQSRDSTDVLIGRWEKILMHHSGSCKLWREFLRVVQGQFSRFKVSDLRKIYAHSIQALSAACTKQFRQLNLTDKAPPDPAMIQLELRLVDIFLNLCRLEWQAGYQELATALLQAEIEFSLFCPSLLLTEQSKHRLFAHFWNSDAARVGEEQALGWCTWLEKEEENRQRLMKEETSRENDEGGWTGWSDRVANSKDNSANAEELVDSIMSAEEIEEEVGNENVKQEDNTEALLKLLGIDIDSGPNAVVKDICTWTRWAEEESSRDCNQWMPVHSKDDLIPHGNATEDKEADEQLLKVIVYEDVSDYMFSLSSEEARLFLLYQFIYFFGGKTSEGICSNSPSWNENLLSLETLPDFVLESLRKIDDDLAKKLSISSSFSWDTLYGSMDDISRRTEMMKFLRNAILLCLTVFPRNYVLEEAAFVAEELSVTRMNLSGCSFTPCRGLAKGLLKRDRQDLLLCGVYARREALFGNIDYARRVFDMALSSVEGLPPERKSNVPLLYLWYAEVELANNSESDTETSLRAIHVLSCLGSGSTYSPFKCQPSSVQLLKARQGYIEKIKAIRSAWLRGAVNDQSIALICSAALFEELINGWTAGTEVLHQAFTMVLPERRSYSYQLEFLFNFNVRMLQRHHKQSTLAKVWETILQGLQIYPNSPELFSSLVEMSNLYTTPNKFRWIFDLYSHKKPSIVVSLYALAFEMCRGGPLHRIRGLFERALANDTLRCCVVLWRWYIAYEVDIARNPLAARRIFFRAVHACPWSKKLWLDSFLKLNSIFTGKELADLLEVMRDKELNLRTDIYEILLRDV